MHLHKADSQILNKEKNSQKCIIAENISISVTFLTGRGSLTSETSFIANFLLTKGELFLNRFLLFFVRIDVTIGPLNKCLNLHHWTRVLAFDRTLPHTIEGIRVHACPCVNYLAPRPPGRYLLIK